MASLRTNQTKVDILVLNSIHRVFTNVRLNNDFYTGVMEDLNRDIKDGLFQFLNSYFLVKYF